MYTVCACIDVLSIIFPYMTIWVFFFGGTSRPAYQAVHCYSIATGAHRCRNIGGGLGHVAMWMILTIWFMPIQW